MVGFLPRFGYWLALRPGTQGFLPPRFYASCRIVKSRSASDGALVAGPGRPRRLAVFDAGRPKAGLRFGVAAGPEPRRKGVGVNGCAMTSFNLTWLMLEGWITRAQGGGCQWRVRPSPPAPLPRGERGAASTWMDECGRILGREYAPSLPAPLPRGERGATSTWMDECGRILGREYAPHPQPLSHEGRGERLQHGWTGGTGFWAVSTPLTPSPSPTRGEGSRFRHGWTGWTGGTGCWAVSTPLTPGHSPTRGEGSGFNMDGREGQEGQDFGP